MRIGDRVRVEMKSSYGSSFPGFPTSTGTIVEILPDRSYPFRVQVDGREGTYAFDPSEVELVVHHLLGPEVPADAGNAMGAYRPIREQGPARRAILRLAYTLLRFAGCEDETCFNVERLAWSPWRSEHR